MRPSLALAALLLLPGAADPVVVTGFAQPESVRFDPARDVWYVGNMTGDSRVADDDGMISRVAPDGTVLQRDFIRGGANGVTLHAPRGMTMVGDTLWVADVAALRGFDATTGRAVASVDLSAFEPGFPNDVAPGPDGALYVTDTPRNRIYRVAGRTATIALEDSALASPNGITWHPGERRFLIGAFDGRPRLLAWAPGGAVETWRTLGVGGRYDGVEVLADGRVVVASQADSSVHVLPAAPGGAMASWRVAGRPADLGVDERRGRVGVPYIARDLIELWPLAGS